MRAVHLVILTRAGQEGSLTPLTAPRWGFYDSLFQHKEFSLPVPYGEAIIHKSVVKLMACEGHGLTAAEASLQLSKELSNAGLDPAQSVDKIEVRTHLPAIIIIDKTGDLHNAADRDHCIQYVIAVILLKGSFIEAQDYQNESPWLLILESLSCGGRWSCVKIKGSQRTTMISTFEAPLLVSNYCQ